MLEVAVGVEVEAYQDCDDLRIGHNALSSAFRSVGRRWQGAFRHLHFKFLAKIVRNTKNFSKFAFVSHWLHDIKYHSCGARRYNKQEYAESIENHLSYS